MNGSEFHNVRQRIYVVFFKPRNPEKKAMHVDAILGMVDQLNII